MRETVFSTFSDKPFVNEMVVTVYSTTVTTSQGVCQPFFRLMTTSGDEHSEEIIQALLQLGLDVEHLQLQSFHSCTKW